MEGTDAFGTTFLFYGPSSYPIYSWSDWSWSVIPGLQNAVVYTITTQNGSMRSAGEIASPIAEEIFAAGFEYPDRIFKSGFESVK